MSSIVLSLIEQDESSPLKPWMRLACMLYTQGLPFCDIAREINQPESIVSSFITSPRGSSLLKTLVAENDTRLDAMLEATAIDSILVLVRLRDHGKTDAVRSSAACQLLDRCRGKAKAINPTDSKNKTAGQFTDVQAEITRLRQDLLETS